MLWATKETLEKKWVTHVFPNLIKLSKKTLLKQKEGFGIVVKDSLRTRPHNPTAWVSGKELRREARSVFIFGDS